MNFREDFVTVLFADLFLSDGGELSGSDSASESADTGDKSIAEGFHLMLFRFFIIYARLVSIFTRCWLLFQDS